ncbi:drug/metabolite transporter (DMT)-like permease [Variovorax boronicumulans]|uniref:Drug/metabolite transporter (DMT)-like permease n=1 Tax=Variovorax boronicumulans TaxID=436515 RepID=A0AAW8D2K8_9BURK|nr:DMT family transporter [Variovorax boronicumulans]MDP9894454.1 drug/metabolite transporter (DMT)-like permease [Variovorax boronicumulans]MDQ0054273.1 drug/metabolite transporter (DMT)-like permease [Variovorax boronicumulans]
MVGHFGMVDITAARFAVFGAVSALAVFARPAAVRWPNGRQALAALGLSVLGFSGYYLLLAFGIVAAGTEVPSLIIGTIPVWMMLLGRPAGLRMRTLLPGLLLTGAGIALMIYGAWSAHQHAGSADRFGLGIALALAAMVSWTVYGLLNASWLQRHTELNATDWANWLGVATGLGALLLWAVAGSDVATLRMQPDGMLFIWVALASGAGSAWLATILWNIASQRLSASLCGQLIVSETLFALLYSFVWDGRWPEASEWVAALLFVLGILASIKAHR